MAAQQISEAEAREVAEKARDTGGPSRSVMREIFLGNLPLDDIEPYPDVECDRPAFVQWMTELESFLRNEVNPDEIDRNGEYPSHVLHRLAELGAFGMKIPEQYGGLGFSQQEYCRALELIATYCGNLVALLSAHQSIGVPQPVKLFGTEEQKQKFLPPCARGAVSAFALTENDVGSDPARLQTTVRKTDEGDYILDGEKLWTTNGTIADLMVVMARDVDGDAISCFVVDAHAPGVSAVHRCRFMGLRAIENGVIQFDQVRVPAGNRIGKEGEGLKIALTTLNTGRLSLPAACVGAARVCLRIAREWSSERVQWGAPVGKHEAVAHKLASMASTTFAMESLSHLCNSLAEREGYDIRLEASAAKEFNTTEAWNIIDETLQIRGGRGFETATSLAERGEPPLGVERMLRDNRINRIFEGTSEIMHLFMAREAVDKHLRVAGALIDPKRSLGQKLAALPGIIAFYAWWYPTRFLGWTLGRFRRFGPLRGHVAFVYARSRKLARTLFHGMLRFGPGLEKKQAFLFRAVDTGVELFTMLAVVLRAQQLRRANDSRAESAVRLADLYCRDTRRRIDARFRTTWRNEDVEMSGVARELLEGRHNWLEEPQLPPATPRVEHVIESKLAHPQAAE